MQTATIFQLVTFVCVCQALYYLTVYVTSNPFGNAYSYVSITTANGYKDAKVESSSDCYSPPFGPGLLRLVQDVQDVVSFEDNTCYDQ
jgi:hypothetical protein